MERTWVDNAFWDTADRTSATAIAESTAKDGKVTRQVLTVLKTAPDGSENPDFIELINSLTEEKINANTTERAERQARETSARQQRQEEKIRAHALEALFEAKLKAFEIEDVKNCTNRILKSKLRRASNIIAVNAYATIIIMEQMNADEKATQTQHNNDGYLVVASKSKSFYYSAINLIESIKDYNPEAKTCLVVDKSISDHRVSVSDHVIYTEKENDYRAKLWGMSKTPFDRTLYVDADMECVHEDIATAFDQLGDHDMMFTKLCEDRDIAFKNRYFPAGCFELNGGVCLYNSSDKRVIDFMYRWWELYTLQKADKWWPTDPATGRWDEVNYGDRHDNKWWDQFTLWWLTHKDEKYSDFSIGIFEDDLRWNYYSRFQQFLIYSKDPPVLIHYSGALNKDVPETYQYG